MLEIAIVVTVVFNYVFLLLWDLNYGAENAIKFMRSPDEDEEPKKVLPTNAVATPDPKSSPSSAKGTESTNTGDDAHRG